ncbi:50S ribosomal protein L6 [Leptospira borgpetersenii]|uniref:Large ribosomal subunit protein uL6 n=5 Tax=Leptospira TaxID=171 RepID=RL6_LEPBJ|nr:50S ribosomal protein L6 [Leptospira borgpetersenii]Q04PV3.1 RecName: Full=Large ribosomal subunit protein uL6; AltName: Full=50S ribosomal protein L6 [Leptospira borgpetersenii serovar Hardjo-bovis str. JB197]EMO60896.1 ribosomal protein L6 [Leptospira borgpetersenii serovar Pomona str. 200901868]ABJ77067.1 50S Ribosomal protein L6 [Leptospira borgpetersenii serovar Hardjo-bovis str. JB197]ABJ78026.1 50S Ribosomal protein L6 [Leptospira borgpetersenii serovar Hardjo-bovis str. L550]ABJ7806
MSRIGKAEIKLPDKVEVKQENANIKVKGPLGELSTPIFEGLSVKNENGIVKLERSNEDQKVVALHGLTRALLMNCVKGVSQGWEKNLEINGVGYRAQKRGEDLVMSLGYSHEVVYKAPKGIKIDVQEQLKIKVTGIDKQLVGQVAADIRSKRPPEPYKGKGIKYAEEFIKKKAGKTGKK